MSGTTKHGAERTKKRLGLSKKDAEKQAAKAFENGLKHSDCKGDLKRYIDSLYFHKGLGRDYRIYNHYVYLFDFKNQKLITVIDLPQKLCKLADKLQKQGD